MKKKLYISLLILAVTLSLRNVPIYAASVLDSGECGEDGGGNVTWALDSEGKLTVRGSGSMGDYPNSDSLPWSAYLNRITSIVIESGVTRIGNSAFRACVNLKAVSLPTTVTQIGNVTFYHCDSLEALTIPESVTAIGANAFGYCALKEITIPKNVKDIGEGAFFKCSALTAFHVAEENGHYSALDGVLFDKDMKTRRVPKSRQMSE